MGAKIVKEERILPYSLRYEVEYDKKDLLEFSSFFDTEKEPIPKLVVCFLAILELTKESLIKINQQSSSSPIYLQLGEI